MNHYLDKLNPEIKEYFRILSHDFPDWLEEYIYTDEMQRIGKISMNCGADYSGCIKVKYFYSNLEHSVGVALIIWNFTHDKTQTLAGLFHDIATPVFKHCIDFMNGDSEYQESTEEKTYEILTKSKQITKLLKRDTINIADVCNYKIYPIADNDIPMLSADRFEYTFSSGLAFYRVWNPENIKQVYNNITITKNEFGNDELCFKNKSICEKYIKIISSLWPRWVSDDDRTMMQFYADMCKSLNVLGELSLKELYTLSEQEIIDKFKNSKDKNISNAWNNFIKCDKVHKSRTKVKNKYCVNVKSKTRYINPLVIGKISQRITDISPISKQLIENYLQMTKGGYYTYFDFDFKPYN